MCLDHGPFRLIHGTDETPLENIASIIPGPGQITLIDAFGKKQSIPGEIAEIDFLNQRVVLG